MGLSERPHEAVATPRPPAPLWLALPRLTSAFLQSAFVIIALPIIVLAAAPAGHKGLHLGLIAGAATALTVATLLGVGHASDGLPGTRVRRRPFIVLGHLLMLPAAVLLWLGPSYALLVAGLLITVVARGATDAAHLPLLNDMVATERRGVYSAMISFMHVLGAAGGGLLAGYLAQEADGAGDAISFLGPLSLYATALALAALLLFVVNVKEKARAAQATRLLDLLRARRGARERAYFRFMAARTVYLVGVFAVVVFLVYLVEDVYRATDFKMAAGIYYAVATVASMAFALPAGYLADRIGCLPVIYISGGVQVLSCALFFSAGAAHPAFAYVAALLFGGAFGGVFAASLALSTKLIPRHGDAAKYMALLLLSTYVAHLVASLVGGAALDLCNSISPLSGYLALFFLAELCFLGGGAIFARLQEPSHPK